MDFVTLTDDNFNLYAAKHYDNPYCFNEREFLDDVNRISTIKRMISWLNSGNPSNIHVIINNIIPFYNVFNIEAATRMLEHKMDESHYAQMNAFLMYLSLPLLDQGQYDVILHRKIAKEYKRK